MNDAVQKIKDRLNIIDVITPYVELQKAGRHLKARCPFHTEKTPSFNVSPDRGMYHCYGCGAGGDMFTFIEAIEGVDFKGALKILAEKANVELTPVSPEKKSERERLFAVMEEATKFYESCLPFATEATEYIKKRGVIAATIGTWRIGFAPGPPVSGWGVVKEHLMKKGFTEKELFKAGLIKESAQGKDSYDVFRNRIMFPLFDQSGHVVGFSGRTMEAGPDIPKYVNSPETELYKKSELLYGYHKAKQGIRQLDFSLIVEGQFDVVMSHQAGYSNTVAVSGTALTAMHVQLLERMSNRVVLALDADKAGIAAVRRSADLMLRRGLDVKVASMPTGADPADMVLKDVREYKHVIGKSTHVIEFLLQVLMEQKLDERTFKLRAREEIVPYILLLPNHIDQDHFEGKLAEGLNTTKEAIHYEVVQLQEKKHHTPTSSVEAPLINSSKKVTGTQTVERHTSLLTYIIGVLPLVSESTIKKVQEILELITGKTFTELEESISPEVRSEVLFRTEAFLDTNPRRIFDEEFLHALNQFRDVTARRELKVAREKLEEAEKVGNYEEVAMAIKRVSELQSIMQMPPYNVDLLK
jgi:DNA primase